MIAVKKIILISLITLLFSGCISNQVLCQNINCNDKNPCTQDNCSEGECSNTILSDGSSCGEGNVCKSGACINVCQTLNCDDDNPCTQDSCSSGACSNQVLSDGTSCGTDKVCKSGSCVYDAVSCEALNCDDDNPCTQDDCSEGTCSNQVLIDETSCGTDMVCKLGECVSNEKKLQDLDIVKNVDNPTQEELDYFFEITLGSEFGARDKTISKWVSDVKIKVNGNPSNEDLTCFRGIVKELNELIDSIELQEVSEGENVNIYFVPEKDFKTYEPNYVPTNLGFFWGYSNNENEFTSMKVLVSTEGITQKERCHLIREELTQSLGLMNDSYKYPESIFYQGWTDTQNYTELDKKIISLLYNSTVKPGCNRETCFSN